MVQSCREILYGHVHNNIFVKPEVKEMQVKMQNNILPCMRNYVGLLQKCASKGQRSRDQHLTLLFLGSNTLLGGEWKQRFLMKDRLTQIHREDGKSSFHFLTIWPTDE